MVRRRVEPLDARGARIAALDALARRDLASHELQRKLSEKGYDSSIVAPLIDRLREEKLLDDDRYLANFLAYHAARGQGPERVRFALRKLKMDPVRVAACIEEYPDWLAQLERARQKKFGSSLPSNYPDQQRQARFLGYRGFTRMQIRKALGLDIDIDG